MNRAYEEVIQQIILEDPVREENRAYYAEQILILAGNEEQPLHDFIDAARAEKRLVGRRHAQLLGVANLLEEQLVRLPKKSYYIPD